MKQLLISLLVFLLFGSAQAQKDTLKVLFLGNSFTGVNSLPTIFSQLASSAGEMVYVESNAPGGYTLNGHSTNATSIQKIKSKKWDYVVLQEQSQIPSIIPDRDTLMYPYAIILDSIIHANHFCTQTTFFMTWAHKNGNLGLPPGSDTYEGMQQRLRSGYKTIADSLEALVSPVGWAWRYVRQNYSNIELYSMDDYHPAMEGTYLAACVFYATFFKKNPVGIAYTGGINASTTNDLQFAAGKIVLDSLSLWNHGKRQTKPTVDFSFSHLTFDSIQFTSTSVLADNFYWDFGDGSKSTKENPTHTYQQGGTYTVSLVAKNACGKDSISKQVLISSIGDEMARHKAFRVYPNPLRNQLNIENLSAKKILVIQLYDSYGKQIESFIPVGKQIQSLELGDLPSGSYLLQVEFEDGLKSFERIIRI